jgi:glycerol-3-phosphate O-acyltransferase
LNGCFDFFQSSGAVFIRREFGDDEVYKAVFHEYISTLLKDGCTVECFIEGGRSRSGKILSPKIGFMKVLVDLLEEDPLGKTTEDVTLFPVAISYDKVVEGTSYVREMLGSSKQKESLGEFVNAVRSLGKMKLTLGSIDVRFGDGISLKQAMIHGKYGPLMGVVSRRRFILHLSYRVMYECNLISTVPATSMVAAVLLTTLNRGIHIRDLTAKVEWLKNQLLERGARVSRVFHSRKSSEVVEQALKVLGRLTRRRNNVIFGYQNLETLELSIYRNQLLHWFVSEAVVAVALLGISSNPDSNLSGERRVQPKILLGMLCSFLCRAHWLSESVRFVSRLLKYEFIYKPAPDIEDNFIETFQAMQRRYDKFCWVSFS